MSKQHEGPVEQVPFLFDDFFVSDEDPGFLVVVNAKGRSIPIHLKRGISVRDKEAATQAAIARHLDENGRLVIDGIDDAALTIELLTRTIKKWPFTTREGQDVPITRQNVSSLLGEVADQLALALKRRSGGLEEEADGPFDVASDAA